MPAVVRNTWHRVCLFLRANALFCLSILLCMALLLLIPQIANVMFQLLMIEPHPADQSFWLAMGFLAYLGFLLAGGFAAVLRVAPPDVSKQPEAPVWVKIAVAAVTWPFLPIWLNVPLRLIVFSAAVALFVHQGFPPVSSLPFLIILMLPLQCLLTGWICGQGGKAIDALFTRERTGWCWALLAGGVGVVVVVLTRVVQILDTPYMLADCVLAVLGVILCGVAVWYAVFARLLPTDSPGRAAMSRFLVWLFLSFLFGEAIWAMANSPVTAAVISFRLYTIWGVLQAVVLIVMTASMMDTLDRETPPPWRVLGLIGLLLFALAIGGPDPEALADPPATPHASRTLPEDWIHHLKQRIDAIPTADDGKPGPVVIVAASGGGSRAAIFSGLTLEALAREKLPGRAATWGDHIVLISGVSGGSLGAARYISGPSGNDDGGVRLTLRNSVESELAERMAKKLPELVAKIETERDQLREEAELLRQRQEQRRGAGGELFEEAKAAFDEANERLKQQESIVEAAKDAEVFARWFRAHARAPESDEANSAEFAKAQRLSWVVHSAIMDDLCTDFMAPVLRGALTPLTTRSEALRRFWGGWFGWRPSNDRAGYTANASAEPAYDWKKHPLAIYNLSDVRRGCRVAVGFPPLPPFFLASAMPRKPGNDAARFPPETLADLDPGRAMPLTDAVGLSANFPFGFSVVTLPRRQPDDRDYSDAEETETQREERRTRLAKSLVEKRDDVAKILDGGIVDNTGIDSIVLAVEAIREKARQPSADGTPNVYRQVWDELLRRRVFLIEIDSGAKPERPGTATRLLSVLLDPVGALNNAGHSNADRGKRRYLSDLESRLSLGVDQSGPLRELTGFGSDLSEQEDRLRTRLLQQQINGVRRFTTLTISANHYDAGNIMTAWSLGPDDKAELLARFLLEMVRARPELARLAALARVSVEDESTAMRKAAGEAVARAVGNRDRFLVLQSIERLGHEFEDVKKRSNEPPDTLLRDLTRLEKQIALVKYRAGKAKLDDKETSARLEELLSDTASARASVAKGVKGEAVLGKYGVRATGQLVKLASNLRKEESAAIKKDQERMDSASATMRLQRDLNRGASESRKTFDRPPAKK